MDEEFNELFVDEEELNKSLLKEILLPFIKLTKNGSIIFEKPEMNSISRILVYLISNKVFKTKSIKPEEAEGPTQIARGTGVPEGTVKNHVIKLTEDRFLQRTSDGKYFVPNFALKKIKEWLIDIGDY